MSIKAQCVWTVKERKYGLVVCQRKNILTNNGLSLLASAWGGGFTPPAYLVINSSYTTITTAVAAGATSVQVASRVDQLGDTQIVLSLGLATQEIVTFTGVTGTGPYTYTLASPTTQSHAQNDYVVRNVSQSDLVSSITNEQQFDPVNAPGLRLTAVSGISQGIGNWTVQFYLTGTQANVFITDFGLADSYTIGAGTLHNHVLAGIDHTVQGNDLEIDASLTLSN